MYLKNKKKRTESSRRWLLRQINDPYVKQAKKEGYRSRAAYKLLEIQKKYSIIKPGFSVIDLGAAPGGWSQILSHIIGKTGHIMALDLLPMEPLENVIFHQSDFTKSLDLLKEFSPAGVDLILSDMSPSTCGVARVDHLRIMMLLEEILLFSEKILKINGHLVTKVFQGGAEKNLLTQMKMIFKKVVHFKPKSSRAESSEMYLLGLFKRI